MHVKMYVKMKLKLRILMKVDSESQPGRAGPASPEK